MTATHALVMDVETSGSDADLDWLLEVGAVLIEVPSMTEIGHFESLVLPGDLPAVTSTGHLPMRRREHAIAAIRSKCPPVVRDMHDRNGLWHDLVQVRADRPRHEQMLPPWDLDLEMKEWLDRLRVPWTGILLAGSGSARFDSTFIKKFLPLLHDRLHWSGGLDVGCVRRIAGLAGLSLPDQEASSDPDIKAHRGLADARAHLDELREWVHLFDRYRHEFA